ncbi:membrane protein [Mycolicibacterium cyprinidarum]|uniref:Membrane protein n=1 Tax=Mycolicibacterium cyprinidarum TaxID=2860311 RepID=A0ABQ4V4W4_9MYCO|nr:membrane protein [Mycolicibacterium sp. NGTWS0302]GJF10245.1 membrane protein [Mycolicibacterium sp. NGTWSNA01]
MTYRPADLTAPTFATDFGRTVEPTEGMKDDLPQAVADTIANLLDRPRARGWIHVYSAGTAIVAGAALVPIAWITVSPKAGWATLIYALGIVAMFGISATYHRVHWVSPSAQKWMMRLDHSVIFVFIAASYTPFVLLAMPARTGVEVLTLVWAGAAAGVVLKMSWPSAPRWVGLPLYLLLGYTAIWFAGTLLDGAGIAVVALLALGGVLYNIGAIFYGFRWPNPWPRTFGHHEFFHAFTAAAALCHYAAAWGLVI